VQRILKYTGLRSVGFAATGAAGATVALHEQPEPALMDIDVPGEINELGPPHAVNATRKAHCQP